MVIYEDKDFLNPVCLTLVVRVDSINKAYGDIASFTNKYKLKGVTNGKLYCVAFMTSPSDMLDAIENEYLLSCNFKFGIDYIYFNTEPYYGVRFEINEDAYKELPYTKGLNWIKSVLLPNGNYVWFTDSNIPLREQEKEVNTIAHFCRSHEDINNINPVLIRENERSMFFKVSYSEHIYMVSRDLIERE